MNKHCEHPLKFKTNTHTNTINYEIILNFWFLYCELVTHQIKFVFIINPIFIHFFHAIYMLKICFKVGVDYLVTCAKNVKQFKKKPKPMIQ